MRVKASRVGAIHEKDDIERLRAYYRANYENGEMYALMVTLGCNMGLRAGDLRRLRVGDLRGRVHYECREAKTGKSRRIYLNERVRDAIKPFDIPETVAAGKLYFDEYQLLTGTKGAIEVKHMHKLVKEGCRAIGLEGNYGSHSLRKTFAYHAYGVIRSVPVVQRLFEHSMPSVTRLYLDGRDEADAEPMSTMEVSGSDILDTDLDYVYAALSL